jgi:hypothetical protein
MWRETQAGVFDLVENRHEHVKPRMRLRDSINGTRPGDGRDSRASKAERRGERLQEDLS